MPVSKKQQACVNRYVAGHYDKITLTVPKGQRDAIKASADAAGESVNGYVKTAIEQRQARDAATPSTNE